MIPSITERPDDGDAADGSIQLNAESMHLITPTKMDALSSLDVDEVALMHRRDELNRDLTIINQRLSAIRAPTTSPPKPNSNVRCVTDDSVKHSPAAPVMQDQHLAQLLNLCMGLPKKDIPKFKGDPIDYWRFYRGFTHGIAQYTTDAANRLAYLISYCEGNARRAIEHCTILEPEEGYAEAWRILKRCYGTPHVIAHNYISSITDGPPIKHDDEFGLIMLAESMKACEATLKELNFAEELNTRSTMSAVVARLPSSVQSKWFDVAASITRTSRLPTFTELQRFVRERADAVATRTLYAVRTSNTNQRNSQEKIPKYSGPRLQTLATTSKDNSVTEREATTFRPRCPSCHTNHYLDECSSFRSLSPVERRRHVESWHLCNLCLKPNHGVLDCRSRKSCGVHNCAAKHHPLLHSPLDRHDAKDEGSDRAIVNSGSIKHKETQVSLGVLPVRIRGPNGELIVNALLDNGSDSTLVDKKVMQTLGLFGNTKVLSIMTMNGESKTEAQRVAFSIEALETTERHEVTAWAVDHLPQVTTLRRTPDLLQRWEHLKGLQLPELREGPVGLLIGMDLPSVHWALDSRCGGNQEPYAVRTKLGWMILGPMNFRPSDRIMLNHMQLNEEALRQLESVYDTEFTELTSTRRGNSREDALALTRVQSSLKIDNGHYQIPLPWKSGCPALYSNREVALKRLRQLSSRLTKDSQLKQMYQAAMNEYITKGYAERAPCFIRQPERVWYIPHHPVFHPQKPNKVRVVYDCACSVGELVLNKQLLRGPDIGNSLFGVLLRFRQAPFVFSADIEAMFHQVRVPEADRRYLRFLWWDDGDMTQSPSDFQMTVHPFGATSSPFCAAFALQQALKDYQQVFDDANLTIAQRCFYVDDCLCSMDSSEGLIRFARQLKTALKAGGFHLTKWLSNVPELTAQLSESEKVEPMLKLDLQPEGVRRTLGVEWEPINDTFGFQLTECFDEPTKRKMLSLIASVYDPLGFMSPAVLPGRLMVQELNLQKIEWDERVPGHLEKRWNNWLSNMKSICDIKVPRCLRYPKKEPETNELHCFCDASENAFGAVVYLRSYSSSGEIRLSFLCGKSRVAPIQGVTIPRLELTAAVLAVRLITQVKSELTLSVRSIFYWTDSMIVLQSIRNTSTRFQVFVANRLSIIHDHSRVDEWHHIRGRKNPADLASRGVDARKLLQTEWLTGPEFLKQEVYDSDRCESGTVPEVWLHSINCHEPHTCNSEEHWFLRLSKFSSWSKLLRAVAWLRRFCDFLRDRKKVATGFITPLELTESARTIARMTQASAFRDELSILKEDGIRVKRVLLNSVSPLRKLNPFLDNGVIRVGGRLKWALIPYDAKHPIILPRRHFVTELIIQYYHKTSGHVGASQVLAAIRNKYWIIQGQTAVRRVISTCHHCRRWFFPPCRQVMAPLPLDRMNAGCQPFAATGVDYFGPFLVKRGRGTEKRYGCLFTCLTVRAVHIEVAHSLDTNAFLCAFSRFVSRRGCPIRLYSDNGTNFKGAESEVRQQLKDWNQEKISKVLSERGCDWIFSVPLASHRGGVWERLIRSIKRILRGLIGERLLDDQTLQTMLTEVEKILNDRPLTKLTSDPDDCTALTPNHLLLLRNNPSTSPPLSSSCNLNKAWRTAQQLADSFWVRWKREYLPTLITCEKWLREGQTLKRGDLVLMVDPTAPRGQWEKAVVEEAVPAKDKFIREVRVRTGRRIYLRDVRQLHLLEASNPSKTDESKPQDECQAVTQEGTLVGEC